eukprot:5239185-Amphidinium_carterae.1
MFFFFPLLGERSLCRERYWYAVFSSLKPRKRERLPRLPLVKTAVARWTHRMAVSDAGCSASMSLALRARSPVVPLAPSPPHTNHELRDRANKQR